MQQRKKLVASLSLALGCLLSLTACQQKNEQASKADASSKNIVAEGSNVASGTNSQDKFKNNPNIIKTSYQCDNGKIVIAVYNNSNINSPRATLSIDGRAYEMYNVAAPSGTLYATEQGINAGQGMRWHVHGLEAILQTMTLDHTADSTHETMLMRCQQPL